MGISDLHYELTMKYHDVVHHNLMLERSTSTLGKIKQNNNIKKVFVWNEESSEKEKQLGDRQKIQTAATHILWLYDEKHRLENRVIEENKKITFLTNTLENLKQHRPMRDELMKKNSDAKHSIIRRDNEYHQKKKIQLQEE